MKYVVALTGLDYSVDDQRQLSRVLDGIAGVKIVDGRDQVAVTVEMPESLVAKVQKNVQKVVRESVVEAYVALNLL